MVYLTSIERLAIKETREEDCHTVRCAILEQHGVRNYMKRRKPGSAPFRTSPAWFSC